MAFDILGFTIKRKDIERENELITISPKEDQENAVEVIDYGTGTVGGAVASFMDLSQVASSETELINRYRTMASQAEIVTAIDHILNEMVFLDDNNIVSVVTDDIEFPDKVKDRIREEFDHLLSLMDFHNNAYEIIRRWYVDGVIRYHVVIDEKRASEGIKAIRYVDPRKIKKVRVYSETAINGVIGGVTKRIADEFFVYSENGFNTVKEDPTGYGFHNHSHFGHGQFKISKDAICSASSGIMDVNNRFTLSYLDQAFRPLNNLRIEEDSTIVYRITRAPERRAFYIDVTGLPPTKAQAHVKQLMDSHNKKLQYNSTTGQVEGGSSRVMTMTDDYWLPRKDGSRGTEIVPLQGGQNLGEIEDVVYFQKVLFRALKVPVSRLESEAGSFLGRQSEISREEQNFALFVGRLRSRFTNLFDEMLERQLILKKVIKPEDWVKVKSKLRYDFKKNNFFEELRNAEVLRERISLLSEVEPFAGKYYSREWVWKNVLNFNDEEIEEQIKEIEDGKKKGYYDDFGDDAGNDRTFGDEDDPQTDDDAPDSPEKQDHINTEKDTDEKDKP